MSTQPSDALVFYGATGDLAYKQIFPALQALVRRGRLDMPVIGVAKSGWNLEQLKARAKDSLQQHGQLDQAAYDALCSHLKYIDGDYNDPGTFVQLHEALGTAQRPLHYLAIPPAMFPAVAQGLAKSGCSRDARVVVEKPFGRDLASAQALNHTLDEVFPEESLFRIDHFLGKEPVQNLIYFRVANPLIEASWNRRHIESMQITMAERFGVAGRGRFYEEVGAIRDVVQNHLLQVLACLTMEFPASRAHAARRDARSRLLERVRTLTPADVVRGQFRGYRDEPGVAQDSQVETYAALRFWIDNDRWAGVPFHVRAGKCLPVTATEVLVRFRQLPHPALDEAGPPPGNSCRFRLQPEVVLALQTNVKKAGELMVGEAIELIAHHHSADEMQPYERLLGDALRGDPTLFAREDSVEAAWRVVDPILDQATPIREYDPYTWGPAEAQTLAPAGGWHDPEPDKP